MKKRQNKAQMSTNILFYIIAAIVLAIIIGYGYNSIHSLSQQTDTLLYIKFKNELEKYITRIQGDPGAVSRDIFDIPNAYNKVCFINWEAPLPPDSSTSITYKNSDNFEPVIFDSWSEEDIDKRSNNNIFLIGNKVTDSFHIDYLVVGNTQDWVCIDTSAGKVKIKLNNLKNDIIVSGW